MEVDGASADKAARKRVPVTDPDRDVMKNKAGGFGPNFTPYVGAAGQAGVLVAEGVTNAHRDAVLWPAQFGDDGVVVGGPAAVDLALVDACRQRL